ncbi:RagB/SusD family nutrient uptake outer membrane protein [Zobellia uliginosa]|uniref:RagB/SusD family nutrient uptake outer membrane protein n=1 Tax=Zobellia uliginosa TaxID=143224 RepID=UPI0026E2FD3E|nr:RagB/SusD family nutrient uptake outer membrane protein [Zobellia uliginosa]MDO6516552.1 RagB/SusD family nutrient uptake outer membrane protein [Zobellia uliginosa]
MKSKYTHITIYILLLFLSVSCNEDDFLKEEPQDFFVTETAYKNIDQFQSSLIDLYAKTRAAIMGDGTNQFGAMAQYFGTDMFQEGRDEENQPTRFGNYANSYNPTNGNIVSFIWNDYYKIVANANTIIARIENSELTDSEKISVGAEAKFFRAFAYRYLVYHFGDVPLLTEEIAEPKTDFTRDSKEDVLNLMVQDFSDAAAGLSDITEVEDGRLHNLVAQHYLAETYISLGEYGQAITAASVVIDNPATSLMTERFGSLASDTEGNVYYDLFRVGNQNRSSGNTEALWVAQMEVDVPGGLLSTSSAGPANLERMHGPLSWTLVDPDGNPGTIGPSSTLNSGGRGIVWIKLTKFWEKDIWGDDYNIDIRSQRINLFRDPVYDNPESAYFGMSMLENPPANNVLDDEPWRITPYLTKVTTIGQHPDNLYADKEKMLLKNSAGSTFRDRYFLRLAATYLLRAEAYHLNGDNANAAIDINKIRARSNGSLINANEVSIDYILDERGRELSFEEPRRLVLHRTGKLVERVRLQNSFNADDIQDFHNLAPIPLSNIEANVTGELKQNPGY